MDPVRIDVMYYQEGDGWSRCEGHHRWRDADDPGIRNPQNGYYVVPGSEGVEVLFTGPFMFLSMAIDRAETELEYHIARRRYEIASYKRYGSAASMARAEAAPVAADIRVVPDEGGNQ
jgi:hypothetical protein